MIVVLAGGVGAAKLLEGLAHTVEPQSIVAVVNTGDDLRLHGLYISPDLDTVTYTLAGVVNRATGWGIAADTWETRHAMQRLGVDTWFQLGDRDLATHIYRTWQLGEGKTLTEVTASICNRLGVQVSVLPMTDSYVPTRVETSLGEMHFQEYFVRHGMKPEVVALHYTDIELARPSRGVLESIAAAEAIVIAPSNPFVSIGPILSVPGVREALLDSRAPVIALTPIVAGRALKGPAAKMLGQLGYEVSAAGVAGLYSDIVDIFVLDRQDTDMQARIAGYDMAVTVTETVMETLADKRRVAEWVLQSALQ